ncbi:MAG TPA: hypothetical protein VJ485_01915 [archaeon]|nr:hypothetical protein [archaeon]
MSAKLVMAWIIGGLFLLGGVWIVQNLELNVGVGEFQYTLALLIALVLFLIAGLCWISVAVATRQELS